MAIHTAEGLVGEGVAGPSTPKPTDSGASASTAAPPAEGPSGTSGTLLTAQEEEALFGDDVDDDEDDDDLDDDDLDALEKTLTAGT